MHIFTVLGFKASIRNENTASITVALDLNHTVIQIKKFNLKKENNNCTNCGGDPNGNFFKTYIETYMKRETCPTCMWKRYASRVGLC